MYKALTTSIRELDPQNIPSSRKALLQPLIAYIIKKLGDGEDIRMVFICTHNSRRSHLSQVWAQALASYFGIQRLYCYSGGTESTALYPAVTGTLRESGFRIEALSGGENKVYGIKYAENEPAVIGFSKRWDHPFNPATGFVAVMTCSAADSDCPFIPGADLRVSMPFEDPKRYDDSPQQAEKYRECSLQIATELYDVFTEITTGSWR
ncbi:arsenate-mycothiol transferase ArsC [Sinomicrobium oceani]|uniref:arsenate-mycothiol transferase ArsC n=1 Tax=Sinomicrobium oceani TaxID=1150368 RepID=UPI00227D1ACD|nr:protein-tyrosine-phosphatase [Sinomicrobium oceani]